MKNVWELGYMHSAWEQLFVQGSEKALSGNKVDLLLFEMRLAGLQRRKKAQDTISLK